MNIYVTEMQKVFFPFKTSIPYAWSKSDFPNPMVEKEFWKLINGFFILTFYQKNLNHVIEI